MPRERRFKKLLNIFPRYESSPIDLIFRVTMRDYWP